MTDHKGGVTGDTIHLRDGGGSGKEVVTGEAKGNSPFFQPIFLLNPDIGAVA